MDRLAVVVMKKKRYGIKTLSKEEPMRLRMRKEERLEIAEAGSNLWKQMRKGEIQDEDELQLWEDVFQGVLELQEEDEVWEKDREALKFSGDMLKRSRLKLNGEKTEKIAMLKKKEIGEHPP